MYVHANGLRAQFMCVHANCLRKLFLGALMLESIPFIGNGSHSWQGCQLERYEPTMSKPTTLTQESL